MELFSRSLSGQTPQVSRADLSETISDFISLFQDALFTSLPIRNRCSNAPSGRNCASRAMTHVNAILAQVIDYNENLDFVGIPELKSPPGIEN